MLLCGDGEVGGEGRWGEGAGVLAVRRWRAERDGAARVCAAGVALLGRHCVCRAPARAARDSEVVCVQNE